MKLSFTFFPLLNCQKLSMMKIRSIEETQFYLVSSNEGFYTLMLDLRRTRNYLNVLKRSANIFKKSVKKHYSSFHRSFQRLFISLRTIIRTHWRCTLERKGMTILRSSDVERLETFHGVGKGRGWRVKGMEGRGRFYLESLTSSLLPRTSKRKKLERMAGSRVSWTKGESFPCGEDSFQWSGDWQVEPRLADHAKMATKDGLFLMADVTDGGKRFFQLTIMVSANLK